jgi:hypothetical protein
MLVRQLRLSTLNHASFAPLQAIEPNLILVFAAPQHFAAPELAPALGQAFPKAHRVGVSTAGEISSDGVSDNSLVITAVHLDKIEMRIAHTDLADMADSQASGERLAQQLIDPRLRAAILLSQGVNVNGSEVIAGVTSILGSTIPLTGGLAGDNGAFTQTWSLLDDQVSNRMMLAIGLYGDAVRVAHGSYGGWRSFGPAREATKTQGNIL